MIRKLLFGLSLATFSLQPVSSRAQGVPEMMYYNFDVSGTSTANLASSPVGLNPAPIVGSTLSIGGTGEFLTTGLSGTGGSPSTNYLNTDWNVNFASSSWTISAYVDMPSSPTNSYIFGDGTQSAGPLTCFFTTAATGDMIRLRGATASNTTYSIDLPSPTFPIVLHYVYDYAAGSLSLYTNGVFYTSVNIGQQSFATAGTNKFYVGASNTNYISLLPINPPMTINGIVDEFRMYNRALTAGEITATWNQPLPLTPCSGAPTAGSATAAQTSICAGANASLNLSGNSIGSGLTYVWQESQTNTAGSYADVTAPASISGVSIAPSSTNTYYRCVVTCGSLSDTSSPILITLNYPITGNFTIDATQPTAGTNFNSFADAIQKLKCGISGPVTLTVAPGSGPYNEQVIIDELPGASASAPLTIKGNNETLTYLSANTSLRSILRLSGVNYITIDSLNITSAPISGQYAYGIQIMNNSNNITVQNCTIDVGFGITSNASAGIVINSNNTSPTITNSEADSITITNNKIIGGYAGITLIGDNTNQLVNNRITNNDIVDFYTYGIYTGGTNGLLIEQNDLHRDISTNGSTFYGIYVSGTQSVNTLITRNKIHNTAGGNTGNTNNSFGISFSSIDAPTGSENIVANNLLYDFNNASGTASALYNSGSDGVYYYYNTVSLDYTNATAGATHGFYQSTQASNISLYNNIISVTRGGSGIKYCYYFNTATTTATSDYNDLYLNPPTGGGATSLVRYGGTDYPLLSNWQGTFQDLMSYDVDPFFNDPSQENYQPLEPLIEDKATPLTSITNDFFNVIRSATTPDLGAIETVFPLEVQLLNFTAYAEKPNAILSWMVADDSKIMAYEVERSFDGKSFDKIGTVNSLKTSSTSNYNYVDKEILADALHKTIYYRIKLMQNNARTQYSPVALLSLDAPKETVTAYPNPMTDYLLLNIYSTKDQNCRVKITDIKGTVILSAERSLSKGDNLLRFDEVQKFAKGVYQLSVLIGDTTQTQKISK